MERKINKIPLIVITGPTASGKTTVSIELAKLLPIEIISADSRQIFKYLDIGTAKPTKEELSVAPHHFIDILYPDQYYSAGKFGLEANNTAINIDSNNKLPVVVGGSGLYVKALCEGFFVEGEDNIDSSIRTTLTERLDKEGVNALYKELSNVDPESARKYSDKNPRRIIRALEYYNSTGITFSEAHEKTNSERNYDVFYFGIDYDRQVLYDRINKRTELMWESGLIEETEKIYSMGYSPGLNSLNTVGYKEVTAYLNGELTKEQAIEEMKKNTRRYAKRQLTWFRRYENMNWMQGSPAEIAMEINKITGINTFNVR